eukprot:scaffold28185_cov121-Skeletonema_dohrnii-CCMP3373.AAC.7
MFNSATNESCIRRDSSVLGRFMMSSSSWKSESSRLTSIWRKDPISTMHATRRGDGEMNSWSQEKGIPAGSSQGQVTLAAKGDT